MMLDFFIENIKDSMYMTALIDFMLFVMLTVMCNVETGVRCRWWYAEVFLSITEIIADGKYLRI